MQDITQYCYGLYRKPLRKTFQFISAKGRKHIICENCPLDQPAVVPAWSAPQRALPVSLRLKLCHSVHASPVLYK